MIYKSVAAITISISMIYSIAFASGNPGVDAKGCLRVTKSGNTITLTNTCDEKIFAIYCGDLKYTKKRCGDGPNGGYYTQSTNLKPKQEYKLTTNNGKFSYGACMGSIGFGHDEFRDNVDGSYVCIKAGEKGESSKKQDKTNPNKDTRNQTSEENTSKLIPLKLYWNNKNDNFTTATDEGENDARSKNYKYVRIEGYIFASKQPGTVPLKQYWSASRGDYFSTATAQGERDAIAANYRFVRIEGYVYPSQVANTVPLKLYWHSKRTDNFTTATHEGERDAKSVNYYYARNEAYIFPAK